MARSVNPGHDREARRGARVIRALLRKLKKLLTESFPPPATIRLEEHDGIVGVITSAEFARMETIDRQELIGNILKSQLSPQERHRVLVIVAVAPDDGTGYLAGDVNPPRRRIPECGNN